MTPLEHMTRNLATLQAMKERYLTTIDAVSHATPVDYRQLDRLHCLKKRVLNKYRRLVHRIASYTAESRTRPIRPHHWFHSYPHIQLPANGLIVGGKNAVMSDTLHKKMRRYDYYYHVHNTTGGSVFLRLPQGQSSPQKYQQYCLTLAIMYSKFWNTPGCNYVSVTKANAKSVTKGSKPGLFLVAQSVVLPVSTVNPIVYYDPNEGLTLHHGKPIAVLTRATSMTYPALRALVGRLHAPRGVLVEALRWLPARGTLHDIGTQ